MTEKIEIHPAHFFDCNQCGVENFVRSVQPVLTAKEQEELRSEHGVQPWEDGRYEAVPMTVECRNCGAKFETQFNGGDEDE